MQYEIIPCADGDAEYIEEQADQAINAIVPPEEGAQEEVFVYQVTDGRTFSGRVYSGYRGMEDRCDL